MNDIPHLTYEEILAAQEGDIFYVMVDDEKEPSYKTREELLELFKRG